MAKFARVAITTVFTAVGAALGGPIGAMIGTFIGTFVGTLLLPPSKGKPRGAASETLRIGEVPRQAIVGRAATAGSLVDAFNYGGKYGTDWEVLVIALADHRCDALEGVYVNDSYVAFAGDGAVAGYNNQLSMWWRPGTETQTVPAVLTANGPGWTANDNGAGVSYVVVAYKADASDAKNPVWPNGRPRFLFVLRGALCYDPRLDSTVGGAGAHRWTDPSTWTFSENPIVTRYKFARGFYACDRVSQPEQLLVGRGLSAVEAPPANLFHRANLCDELVDAEPRYRVGGLIEATEPYIDIENDFAAACAGTIVQPEGSVEIDPGEAKAPVMTITDADLVVGSKVKRRWFLGIADRGWVNSVVASYIEPGQKWAAHTAPVRRDIADIQADGAPREEALQLGFVLWQKQAGRIAEIVRRLGRLHVRAELVLPPRFCELEEGDWIVWQSDRYLNGQAFTFRIEAWGSDRSWQHSVVLRQISASCYADTAPLTDGSVAVQQAARPAIGAPSAPNWSLSAGHLSAGGIRTPALIVSGASDDPSARFVRMEYVQGAGAPNAGTVWSDAGVTGPDVKRREIAVAAGGVYRVGISYVVDGIQGDRLVLGPVTALGVAYPDGTPVENVQPGEPGATVGAVIGDNLRKFDDSVPVQSLIITPEGTAAAIAGQGALATANQAAYGSQISGLPSPISPANLLASGSRLSAAFMQYTGGPTIESLQPSQAGADVTSTKTAAAIAGQADWATYSGINTTNMAGRVSALDTGGNLSALDKVTNRRLTLLKRADGTTDLTEALAITSLGTAAAIAGQGSFATVSSVGYGSSFLTGFGTLAPRSTVLAGSHLRNSADTVFLGDVDIITPQGTAAAIAGQGPGATAVASDVLNNRTESGVTLIKDPVGGSFNGGSISMTGAVKIRLPVRGSTTMLKFTVDIYNYSTGESVSYIICGYNYGLAGSDWLNVSAQMIGARNRSLPVYFGHDGVKDVVWIGTASTVWSHPQVRVRDLVLGYSGTAIANWDDGWLVSLDTAAPTNVAATVAIPRANDAVFGEGVFESSGLVTATLPNFKTTLGTSAAIAGQADWATYTGLSTGVVANRTANLDNTTGNLSALDKITNRRMTLLKRADGATDLTEALAITSLGTAAAIAGQGSFATLSQITNANVSSYMGAFAINEGQLNTNAIRLGANVRRSDGTTFVTDATAITALGTAAAIAGQGPGATATANEVLNNRQDGNILTIARPVGGQISVNSPGVVGALKIRLPQADAATMVKFYVDVYDYSGETSTTYVISGYQYTSTYAWINVSVQFLGNRNRSRAVRFGYDGVGACVWIGETNSAWEYPQIVVRDFVGGYSNTAVSTWATGWVLSFDTTAATNVVTSIAVPRAGDTVFGEGAFETAGGAVATLPNFKTPLGTAAAIAGQAAAATDPTIESAADVTSNITGPTEIAVECDSNGNPTSLPKTTAYKLLRNGSDITATATWTLSVISGTITQSFGAAGQHQITAMGSATAKVRLTATVGSRVRNYDVTVSKANAQAATGGSGSGGTSATTAVTLTTASTSMVVASGELIFNTGTIGTATLSGIVFFEAVPANPAGTFAAYWVWQRWNGSAWVDEGTETVSALDATVENEGGFYYVGGAGELRVSKTVTGLATSSQVKFRLRVRVATARNYNFFTTSNLGGTGT